jgi:hypothetical protein
MASRGVRYCRHERHATGRTPSTYRARALYVPRMADTKPKGSRRLKAKYPRSTYGRSAQSTLSRSRASVTGS